MASNWNQRGRGGSGKPRKVFHYTDRAGLQGILQTGRIQASTNTSVDAYYGQGVYATSMHPANHSWHEIAQNNYDGHWQSKAPNTEIAIQLNSNQFSKADSGRDVYVHYGDMQLPPDAVIWGKQ